MALWQANFFQSELTSIGVASEIKIITTKGDRIQHLSFDKIEGKGFFTKEIEDALLNKDIDVAIHSHKDLETQNPPGLVIAGVSERENPIDLILVHPNAIDRTQSFGFKKGAVVGTSSARRKGQIFALRPDISIQDIRGNVPTRINKLRSGDFDAILLAAAGVERLQLDLSDLHVEQLDPHVFIPAPAQGVLAYQCREDDTELIQTIRKLHSSNVAAAIGIERGILSGFGGGCHIPIGVHAIPNDSGFDVLVNHATAWEAFPNRVHFQATDTNAALEKFAQLSEQSLPKSVFISRSLEDDSFLKRGCEAHGAQIKDQPLIQVSNQPFDIPSDMDWVFFSSSNAVRAFFAQHPDAAQGEYQWGAIGAITAQTLHEFIDQADFIGEGGSTEGVAVAFAARVGNDRVFFPQSSIAKRTMQQQLQESQYTEATAYNTELTPDMMPDEAFEAYMFTSPSNVKAFAQSDHRVPADAHMIAIGQTTAEALKALGHQPSVAAVPHEAELFSCLAS